jgi:hypothetical protein
VRRSIAPPHGLLLAAAALALTLAAAGLAPQTVRALFDHRDDWKHVKSTLAVLSRTTPQTPVVYLLGGSSARESVTTEASWRDEIAASGGGRVLAYNLGAASQSFSADIAIVNAMPSVPSIVVIGLNVGRYTSRVPARGSGSLDLRTHVVVASRTYDSHRFHNGDQLPDATKRSMASLWLAAKYPVFKTRYRGNAAALRRLIAACQRRGFSALLVELPVNESILGHAWDAARLRYARDARREARAAGIPYIDLAGRSGLVSSDFADLNHLVESGRVKYQHSLSRLVAARLRSTGLRGWRRPSLTRIIRGLSPLWMDLTAGLARSPGWARQLR